MFLQIAILAVLIESIVEVIKWAFEGDFNKWRVIALVAGVLITPLTGLDLFAAVGIPLVVPWVGPVGIAIGAGLGWFLTGVLVCRGSGVVNNLLDVIARMKDVIKPEQQYFDDEHLPIGGYEERLDSAGEVG